MKLTNIISVLAAIACIACGRYSPNEVVSTYKAYETGISQIDTSYLTKWADESEKAIQEQIAILQDASDSLVDAQELIEDLRSMFSAVDVKTLTCDSDVVMTAEEIVTVWFNKHFNNNQE